MNRAWIRSRRLLAALLVVGLTGSVAMMAAGTPRYRSLSKGGLDGSGQASMQLASVPARVARVAVVPKSDPPEFWAIGLSNASLPSWNPNQSPGGQVVFLRYKGDSGWVVSGPPLDEQGRVLNPVLASFDLSSNGEGWAVGDQGLILRKAPGSNDWIRHGSSGLTGSMLNDVSLFESDGRVSGFAVGADATVLLLRGGSWSADPGTAQIVSTDEGTPELISVSAASDQEAWTVTGSGSRALYVFRRSSNGWARVLSDDQTFDGPHPRLTNRGFTISAANGASVEVDPRGGAWVGGSILPSDPAHPFGNDGSTGDPARPFVLRFGGGETVSYCPDVYWVRVEGSGADTTSLCDNPFPLSALEVTDIQVVGERNPQVFAGGLGFYRFDEGSRGWFREPNANGYLVSIALSSSLEGWMASTGNTFGAGGAVHSSTPTIGHWTARPEKPRTERWPATVNQVLEAVATSPDGKSALAVGSEGAAVRYEPGVGWDRITKTTSLGIHGVAWPLSSEAWAVGEKGLILRYDGSIWRITPDSQKVTTRSLFGVAFNSSGGYAVGANGTILRRTGGGWHPDPASSRLTKENLYAITANPMGFTAVGAKGTVIENIGGKWSLRPEAKALTARPGRGDSMDLWAVTSLPDGSVVAGGSLSALITSSSIGSPFRTFDSPIEGTVLALGVAKGRLLASVSPPNDLDKYKGDRVATGRSGLLVREDAGWRDIQFSRVRSLYIATDPSNPSESVLGIAGDRAGRGWAVGGFPQNTPDEEGHLSVSPIGSVHRIDLVSDPKPVGSKITPRLSGPISFAFFSDSACGRGLCSATAGSATMGDAVALQIREEINAMSKLPGGPKFVLFGGNGRLEGIPEEVQQFGRFLKGFDVPAYGALGNKDLFEGLESGSFGYPDFISPLTSGYLGSNKYWMENLSDAPAPWGDGSKPSYIKPVTMPAAQDDLARTYYGFDFAPGSKPLFRVLVLNSSTRSYGRTDGNDQNPQFPQQSWFTDALLEASTKEIPTIVAMNQPTIIPASTQINNWPAAPSDKRTFEDAVVASRVTAVLTGGLRVNSVDHLPLRQAPLVPVYIMGAGGAPAGGLGAGLFPDSKLPSDGFYPAWHLVTVDPSKVVNGQMAIKVDSFPVLEYASINAWDGKVAQAGQPLRFKGLLRSTTGGFSDPEQSKTIYQELGWDAPEPCSGPGQGFGSCRNINSLMPAHSFYSEDPSIADFVVPRQPFNQGLPLRSASNAIVRDPSGQHGYLCTFKPGTTYINLVSGFHRSRVPITVTGGFGPCVDREILEEPVPPSAVPELPLAAEPAPAEIPFSRLGEFPQTIALIFPPPPAPVVAPAPPASVGLARKEEVEEAEETQGSDAVRMAHTTRYDTQIDIRVILAVLIVTASAAAIGGSALVGYRRNPRYLYASAEINGGTQ